jgi:hypothetical protein
MKMGGVKSLSLQALINSEIVSSGNKKIQNSLADGADGTVH